MRRLHNHRFIRQQLRRKLSFKDCELDRQQHEAVIAGEDAQLVLASAGSGKTLSLMAKIQYLVEQEGIPPPQILVISFTNKTVRELIERCSYQEVEIRTFHGLGNQLLRFNERSGLDAKHLVSGTEQLAFVRRAVWERHLKDPLFARRFNDFLLFDYSTPQGIGSYPNHQAKVRFHQRYLRRALSSAPTHHDADLRASPVRSKEAELLANWLTIHRVRFLPDVPYPHYRAYRPSLTIFHGQRRLHIDLLELQAGGQSIYGVEYLRSGRFRHQLHRKYRTLYLQLKTADWQTGAVFRILSRFLKRHGLTPRRLPESAILAQIIRSSDYRRDFDALLAYFCSYITQFKNALQTFPRLSAQINQLSDAHAKRRSRAFMRLFRPLYYVYERWLEAEQAYDFVDMINRATETVQDIAECGRGYQYLLLDEAQDLSPNRFQLIQAILNKNPGCRFFAVGDDWQSIYRFTGSHLGLIYDFEGHFRRYTRQSLIEHTHRFGQPTIRTSCDFIMKNPRQVRKFIRGNRDSYTPIQIVLSDQRDNDSLALQSILHQISDTYPDQFTQLELQIISRYNNDIRRLKPTPELEIVSPELARWQGKDIPFCSMHKSKGITRDIVIVLNMNSSTYGMPATRENDPLSDLLLAEAEDYPFAEERRLFYVAITRARLATYLIAERRHPSPFLFEISSELNEHYQKLCPRCRSGELLRKGNISYCSNYRYGCSYHQRHTR